MNEKMVRALSSFVYAVCLFGVSTVVEARTTTVDVSEFRDVNGDLIENPMVVGTARLKRSKDGIRLSLETGDLGPGNAYTVWWVLFNVPAECIEGCNGADLTTDGVNASLMNAGGGVADAAGNFSLTAFLPAGFMHTNPGVEDATRGQRQTLGPGLQDPMGAEVHIVVRCHGPARPTDGLDQRELVEQTSYLDAFCEAIDDSGNEVCFDAQAAVFE